MPTVELKTGRVLGDGFPPYISAEINTGHFGNMDLAMKAVEAASAAGSDCIKFQSWKPESLFTEKYLVEHRIERRMFDRLSLDISQFRELTSRCGELNIDFCSTPYSLVEIDELLSLDNVPFIKIASMDINNLELLSYAGETKAPIVLSSGMADIDEVRRGVETILATGNDRLVLLHCTSVYPTADDELNLRNIRMFRREFPGIVVGYSDHSLGLLAAPVAVGMGAALIEKHFTLDKSKPGFDNAMALTVDQLAELTSACRVSSTMLGSADRVISESEMKQRGVMRRSIFASRALKSGEVIDRESIQLKRPGTSLGPDVVAQIIGRSVSRDLEEGDPIEWDFLA